MKKKTKLTPVEILLAKKVIFALKYLRLPSGGAMMTMSADGTHFETKAWEEDFMDALDKIGYKLDRKMYWEQRSGKKKKRT